MSPVVLQALIAASVLQTLSADVSEKLFHGLGEQCISRLIANPQFHGRLMRAAVRHAGCTPPTSLPAEEILAFLCRPAIPTEAVSILEVALQIARRGPVIGRSDVRELAKKYGDVLVSKAWLLAQTHIDEASVMATAGHDALVVAKDALASVMADKPHWWRDWVDTKPPASAGIRNAAFELLAASGDGLRNHAQNVKHDRS
ncbi:MAG: hypothetical protein ACRCWF_06000 [Beijerinckiaceae bacterium]